ncbi:hypothetical protein M1466_00615 [Candidatus Dependentiae bacterium]|nr:hypothetical protein [Candidatus Dependentiae bacterium]
MKYIGLLLCCIIAPTEAVIQIGTIENRTFDGVFKVFLERDHSVLLSPREKGGFANYLTTGGQIPIVKIACMQGEYEPIFVQAFENIFTYAGDKRSVKIALWVGAPSVDDEQKTFISTYAGSDARYGLIIHRDGIPEIICLEHCDFLVPDMPLPVEEPIIIEPKPIKHEEPIVVEKPEPIEEPHSDKAHEHTAVVAKLQEQLSEAHALHAPVHIKQQKHAQAAKPTSEHSTTGQSAGEHAATGQSATKKLPTVAVVPHEPVHVPVTLSEPQHSQPITVPANPAVKTVAESVVVPTALAPTNIATTMAAPMKPITYGAANAQEEAAFEKTQEALQTTTVPAHPAIVVPVHTSPAVPPHEPVTVPNIIVPPARGKAQPDLITQKINPDWR